MTAQECDNAGKSYYNEVNLRLKSQVTCLTTKAKCEKFPENKKREKTARKRLHKDMEGQTDPNANYMKREWKIGKYCEVTEFQPENREP